MHTSAILRAIGLLSVCAFAGTASAAPNFEATPQGNLDLHNKYVRNGMKVQVSWQIVYPPELSDLITIYPGGRFKTLESIDVTLHAVGMEYETRSHDNGHGNNGDGVDSSNPGQGGGGPNGDEDETAPLDDELSENGNFKVTPLELDATLWVSENGAMKELFTGGASDLKGGLLYHQSSLPPGTTVDLAAHGKSKRGSNPIVTTAVPSPNLIALKDGDPLPAGVAAFETGQIADFLSPYVRNGHIQLGPLQVLYLFDLDAMPGNRNYNLQDLGVLVSVQPNQP